MFRVLGKLILWMLAIVGLVVLVVVGAAALVVPRVWPHQKPLPEAVLLTVDLDQTVLEGTAESWLPGGGGDGIALRTLLEGLERAAADDRVKGLVARVRSPDMGMAQAQEVRDAVHAFRANGKPTYVYAETMPAGGRGTLAYYLASAFETIVMQPSGEVGLIGVAMETPFLAAALEDWGLSFEVSARQEYKGALASLSEESMPPPQEENMRRLVASWFDQMQAGISAARGVSLAELGQITDRAPLLAGEAQAAGLIDTLAYADAFEETLETAFGDAKKLSVARYVDRRDDAEPEDARRIAVIHGVGPVLPGGGKETADFGMADTLRAGDLADAIDAAVEDERVAAIVLRLNSPGGDYVAADTARRAVERARERGTPMIVSMGDVVASGGYFIALEADRILASPGTITGSIGVAAGKLVARDLWDDLGVSWTRLAEGRNAAMWSVNDPFSLAARRALDRRLDAVYEDFTERVGAARDLSGEALDRAARGRVFTGADAVLVGLVDQTGGLRTALQVARDMAALPADEPVVVAPYPAPRDPLTRLLRLVEERGLPGLASGLGGLSSDERRALTRLLAVLGPVLSALDPLMTQADGVPGTDSAARLRYDGPTGPTAPASSP